MDIKLKPHASNLHPAGGFLIPGHRPMEWVRALQNLQFSLEEIAVYPLPGQQANLVWGCLVVPVRGLQKGQAGRYEVCQVMVGRLYIPEYATITPNLPEAELQSLLGESRYVFHPEIGWAELPEAVNWSDVLDLPEPMPVNLTQPARSVRIPRNVKSFYIQPEPPESVLEEMEEEAFPDPEKMKEEPLNDEEKKKLEFYRKFFQGKAGGSGSGTGVGGAGGGFGGGLGGGLAGGLGGLIGGALGGVVGGLGALGGALGGGGFGGGSGGGSGKVPRWISKMFPGDGDLIERMQQDFDDLERRNKNEIEKLMDLLKDNPLDALKYAIPLDMDGTNRGGDAGALNLGRRWGDFSLFGNSGQIGSSGGGGSFNIGDHFERLRQQYRETAEELIRKGEIEKAAFVYLKLLNDTYTAADTLKNGKLYEQAASVYLKYCKDKGRAAECYEEGRYLTQAIELYKELNRNEKVGDLYVELNHRPEANQHYQIVVDEYCSRNQYLKGALLYRQKMLEPEKGQDLLLRGWREDRDAFNCLNNYFHNLPNSEVVYERIMHLYENEVNAGNRRTFLKGITHEHQKYEELRPGIRDVAYEIISVEAKTDGSVVEQLPKFNPEDEEVKRDTLRYSNRRHWARKK